MVCLCDQYYQNICLKYWLFQAARSCSRFIIADRQKAVLFYISVQSSVMKYMSLLSRKSEEFKLVFTVTRCCRDHKFYKSHGYTLELLLSVTQDHNAIPPLVILLSEPSLYMSRGTRKIFFVFLSDLTSRPH